MSRQFIQVSGSKFILDGKQIHLRGYTLGSWMNLEHFMIGMPGTSSMIHNAFEAVYGKEKADAFFVHLLHCMVDDDDIAFLKAIGTNTLRIPLSYHWFLDDQAPGTFIEDGFRELERVASLCRKHGLYMILDLHSAPGGQNNDWHADNITGQSLFWKFACFREQTCLLWQEIARRYTADPWVVGYDVINEPTYGLAPGLLSQFYDQVTDAIRSVDPSHIIFLEGEDFGRSFEQLHVPNDPQTAFAVHFYPFVLEENVLDPAMPDSRRWTIFEDIFSRQIKRLEGFNRPVWCGESGYNFPDGQESFYARLLGKNIDLCE